MTKKEVQNLEICKASNMVTWKSRIPPEIANLYWRWCHREKKPYVQLVARRGLADIMMDCPWVPSRMDDEAKQEIEILLRQNGCLGPPRWGAINIVYEEVPLEIATNLAAGFYQIAIKFGQRKGVNS